MNTFDWVKDRKHFGELILLAMLDNIIVNAYYFNLDSFNAI